MPCTLFTLEDLHTKPDDVFCVVHEVGEVMLQNEHGTQYLLTLAPKVSRMGPLPDFEAYRARLRATGYVPPLPEQMERLHKVIAGEE